MKKSALVLAALAAVSAAPTYAAEILTQSPHIPGGGAVSSGNTQFFEDFKLSAVSMITGVDFWSQSGAPQTMDYEISFWNLASGSFSPDVASGPIFSALVSSTSREVGTFNYIHEAVFATPALLPADTSLFISIYGVNSVLSWRRAADAPSPGTFSFPASVGRNRASGALYFNGVDLAFRLNGTQGIAPAIPEPSTWAMLIIGFGAIGGAQRRRRGPRLVPA